MISLIGRTLLITLVGIWCTSRLFVIGDTSQEDNPVISLGSKIISKFSNIFAFLMPEDSGENERHQHKEGGIPHDDNSRTVNQTFAGIKSVSVIGKRCNSDYNTRGSSSSQGDNPITSIGSKMISKLRDIFTLLRPEESSENKRYQQNNGGNPQYNPAIAENHPLDIPRTVNQTFTGVQLVSPVDQRFNSGSNIDYNIPGSSPRKNRVNMERFKKVFGAAMGFMDVFSGIAGTRDIISMFLPQEESSELKFMRTNFEAVNGKLDEIFRDFGKTRKYLKYKYNFERLINAKSSIMSAEKQFIRLMHVLDGIKDKKEKARILKQFMDQWEINNMERILTVIENSFLEEGEQNFVNNMEDFLMCDWLKIAPTSMYILKVYERVSIPLNIYYKYKGISSPSERIFKSHKKMIDRIFDSFDRCIRKTDQIAKEHIATILRKQSTKSTMAVSNSIKERLDSELGWWYWTVIVYDVEGENKEHVMSVSQTRGDVVYVKRKKDDDDKVTYRWVFAMKQPNEKQNQALQKEICTTWKGNIRFVPETVISVHRTKGKVNDFSYAGPGITANCKYEQSILPVLPFRYPNITFSFMQTALSNPCISNPCHNHGICKYVPLTENYFCQCLYGFGRANCDEDIQGRIQKDSLKMIDLIGDVLVPDNMDIYYDSSEVFEDILDTIGDMTQSFNDTKNEILEFQKMGFAKLENSLHIVSKQMGLQFQDVKQTLETKYGNLFNLTVQLNDEFREEITKELIYMNKHQRRTSITEGQIVREIMKSSTFLVRKDIKESLNRILSRLKTEANQNLTDRRTLKLAINELGKKVEISTWYAIFGKTLLDFEYVLSVYVKMLSKEFSEEKFIKLIGTKLKTMTFHDLKWKVEKMLINNMQFGPSTDLFQAMKHQWKELPYERYITKVSGIKIGLIYALTTLSKIQLLYTQWLSKRKGIIVGPTTDEILRNQIKLSVKFLEHLSKSSCPVLHAEKMINPLPIHYSYDGIIWKIKCEKGYAGWPESVTCRNLNGKLEWNTKPVCHKKVIKGEVNCHSIYSTITSQSNGNVTECLVTCGLPELLVDCTETSRMCSEMPCSALLTKSECLVCPVGYFSPANEVACRQCSIGSYSDIADAKECIKCPSGKFSLVTGASECKPCQSGFYSSLTGASNCYECPEGTYSGSSSSSCIECKAGLFSHKGYAACKLCPAGKFSILSRSSSCLECLSGQISSAGSSSCTDCRAGYYSNDAKTACEPCSAGYYSVSGSFTCSSCGPGTYSNRSASSSCEKCPPGQYSTGFGATMCITCSAGTISANMGSTICDSCNPGSFSYSGASKCTQCPGGTFSSNSESRSCATCPAGKYSNGYNPTSCKDCSAGFKSTPGSIICSACSPGYYSSSASSSCYPCSDGEYSDAGSGSCTKCPAGTYSSVSASAICSSCPTGTYSPNVGRSDCSSCPEGKYANRKGMISCLLCPSGQYVAERGSSRCYSCPTGYYSQYDRRRCYKNQQKTEMKPDHWGKDSQARWNSWKTCRDGEFARGYDIKIHTGSDMEGLTELFLICETHYIKSDNDGGMGDYGGNVYCNSDSKFIGFSMQACNSGVGATDIYFFCGNAYTHDNKKRIETNNWPDSYYGPCKWSTPAYCPVGYAICGFRDKSEPPTWGDDSAINDFYFRCCPVTKTLYYP